MDAPTQTTVLRDHVLPALAANNITTRVLVYDHNWIDPIILTLCLRSRR